MYIVYKHVIVCVSSKCFVIRSVGCILYEMLTSQQLFPDNQSTLNLQKRRTENVFELLPREYSFELKEILNM